MIKIKIGVLNFFNLLLTNEWQNYWDVNEWYDWVLGIFVFWLYPTFFFFFCCPESVHQVYTYASTKNFSTLTNSLYYFLYNSFIYLCVYFLKHRITFCTREIKENQNKWNNTSTRIDHIIIINTLYLWLFQTKIIMKWAFVTKHYEYNGNKIINFWIKL